MTVKAKCCVVVSDSKTAVSSINGSGVGSWLYSHQILDIRNCLGKLLNAHVEFCSRDYNAVADLLAKHGADGGVGLLEWSL